MNRCEVLTRTGNKIQSFLVQSYMLTSIYKKATECATLSTGLFTKAAYRRVRFCTYAVLVLCCSCRPAWWPLLEGGMRTFEHPPLFVSASARWPHCYITNIPRFSWCWSAEEITTIFEVTLTGFKKNVYIWQNFLSNRIFEHCNWLATDVVTAQSIKIFKNR